MGNLYTVCCSERKDIEEKDIPKQYLKGMLNSFPNGIEYDHIEQPQLDALFKSSVFGGSLLKPVAKDIHSKRKIYNTIDKTIDKMEIDLE